MPQESEAHNNSVDLSQSRNNNLEIDESKSEKPQTEGQDPSSPPANLDDDPRLQIGATANSFHSGMDTPGKDAHGGSEERKRERKDLRPPMKVLAEDSDDELLNAELEELDREIESESV